MKNSCEIVMDLIPLYIDGVCSDASKKLVYEHITECKCSNHIMNSMHSELAVESINYSNEDVIFKKTAWKIGRKTVFSLIGVFVIILYWLVYFWQNALSEIGDYRFFSYKFHELYTHGMIIIPSLTLLWLVIVVGKLLKRKMWRRYILTITVLTILLIAQSSYLYDCLYRTVSVSSWTEVEEVYDEYHIIIEVSGEKVVLETTPNITELLSEGIEYGFVYEYKRNDPTVGVLKYIYKGGE